MGSDSKALIGTHVLMVLLLYTAPFWLDWRLVSLAVVLNEAQARLFKGCLLTKKQFGSTEMSFQEWMWTRLGVKITNRPKFNRFLKWQLPLILIAAAVIWQVVLGFKPLVRL